MAHSPLGRTFIFRVSSWRSTDAWRTIELSRDQTLHDLHLAIQQAFELDDDHAYAFFLNGRAWDAEFECGGPSCSHPASSRLASLPLRLNKRFLYIFDFGDELRHDVRVVGEATVEAGASYPRILESHGIAPPQYPDPHDHDEAEDEPDEAELDEAALSALVPAVARALERSGQPAVMELLSDRDLALSLLKLGGDDAVVFVASELARPVWEWIECLPMALASAGLHEDALALASKLMEDGRSWRATCCLPLLLAQAGRPVEARERLSSLLDGDPDDPLLLCFAGQTLEALREQVAAEERYREGLSWVGGDQMLRDDITGRLRALLVAAGRTKEAEALDRSEQERELASQREWACRLGLRGPDPIRRAGPKLGRNDPCPCGSGAKYKRCCLGKGANA